MEKIKHLKKLIASLLVSAICFAAAFAVVPGAVVSAEEESSSVTWNFVHSDGWGQTDSLGNWVERFGMDGYVDCFGSQQWVTDSNSGLMTVGDGAFYFNTPRNASLTITYISKMAPAISVAPSSAGPWTTLDVTPVLNNGVYTIDIEGIGAENSCVLYDFPSNSGWDGYASHKLRTITYKESDTTVWNFLDNATYTQKGNLNEMPFDMPGLVSNYGSQAWVSHDNMGLMTVGGGAFTVKTPTDASLKITYAGNGAPTIAVASLSTGPWTTLDVTPVLNDKTNVYTVEIDGIGIENSYVQYTFPSNGGWGDYAIHKLRTLTYKESDATVWNFLDNATWTQNTDLNAMPFSMPGLVSNYGSQQWVSDGNLGLMTVGGGVLIFNTPKDASLKITYAGEEPTIAVASSLDGQWTDLEVTPVLDNGVYTIEIDGIGIENSYVEYTFPENSGWDGYNKCQLRTVTFNKRKLLENPQASNVFELRKFCLGIEEANLSYDFHSDEKIDILDLVALKKIVAVA